MFGADRPVVGYKEGLPVYGWNSPESSSGAWALVPGSSDVYKNGSQYSRPGDANYGSIQQSFLPKQSSDPQGVLTGLVGKIQQIPGAATFAPPDPSQVGNTPEARFAMQQGVNAIDRSSAAQGSYGSGGMMQALMQY